MSWPNEGVNFMRKYAARYICDRKDAEIRAGTDLMPRRMHNWCLDIVNVRAVPCPCDAWSNGTSSMNGSVTSGDACQIRTGAVIMG